ncbi:MAG: MATE family efflux transporter [Clostridium sp.]|nr:MATE family efflux transporter [Clostridium sp.]
MKKDTVDLINGNLPKNIIRFTLPIIAMGLLQNLFIACDDMVVLGIFAGDKSLAAVGATTYLVNLFVNVFLGLSVGANVVTAQSIGAKDKDKTARAVHTSITAGAIFGMLLFALGFSLSGICLEWMKTPADIIDRSALYLQIYFFSAPATIVFSFCSAILRANGNSKRSFAYLTLSGFADIILNVFFVLVCNLDVAGVALGTVISQWISAVLIVRYLSRDNTGIRFIFRDIGIDWTILKEILWIGIPTGINNMVFSISNTQIQSSINLFGSAAVAGCSASATMEQFVYTSTNSVMQSAISFVGQNIGAKRKDNIPQILKWHLLYTSMIGIVFGSFVFAAGKFILPLILDEALAVDYGMIRNTIIMLPYMFCGIMEVFAGAMRGLGKSMTPTIVTLIGACGFRIIWIHTVFGQFTSLNVLFLSFPISWILTAAAHFICYTITISALFQRSHMQL